VRVRRKDHPPNLYAVKYEYSQDGRLCKATNPTGQEVEIKYEEEKVMVARK